MTDEATWWPVAQSVYFAAGGFWAMLLVPDLAKQDRFALPRMEVLLNFVLVFGVMWTWPVIYWTAAAEAADRDNDDWGGWDGRA